MSLLGLSIPILPIVEAHTSTGSPLALHSLPSPASRPVLIYSVGRILRKPPDPAEGKGMHRISSRSQIHRKDNFFHSLFLSPPWLLPSKITLDGKFSYPASASGILIQECQHLYLFKVGGWWWWWCSMKKRNQAAKPLRVRSAKASHVLETPTLLASLLSNDHTFFKVGVVSP